MPEIFQYSFMVRAFLAGAMVGVLAPALGVFLVLRRLIMGPEAEGLFTLFAIAFFLIGLTLFGIGLLGEYIGRIYQQVKKRPITIIEKNIPEDPK